jgi:hypothetical protein
VTLRLPALAIAVAALALLALAPAASAAPPCTVDVFVSDHDDRADAERLEGKTVLGDVFVFAETAGAPLSQVTFTLSGAEGPLRTVVEDHLEWDLGTTEDDGRARPLPTTDLPDGTYTLLTEWVYADSAGCEGETTTSTTQFTVDNARTCRVNMVVSGSSNRRGADFLDGKRLTGDAHVFLDAPDRLKQERSEKTAVIDQVAFTLYRDGVEVLRAVEGHASFDLLGTLGNGRARPLRTSLLPPGDYVLNAEWVFKDESIFGCGDVNKATNANFTVGADGV